jgi:hypothetical protein
MTNIVLTEGRPSIDVDQNTRIVFIHRTDYEAFATATRHGKGWFYQYFIYGLGLTNTTKYFKPMQALYRYLLKNKLTDRSIKYLASAKNRTRNGGYAIGTPRYKDYQSLGMRLDQRSKDDAERLAKSIEAIQDAYQGTQWAISQRAPDKFELRHPVNPQTGKAALLFVSLFSGAGYQFRLITGVPETFWDHQSTEHGCGCGLTKRTEQEINMAFDSFASLQTNEYQAHQDWPQYVVNQLTVITGQI